MIEPDDLTRPHLDHELRQRPGLLASVFAVLAGGLSLAVIVLVVCLLVPKTYAATSTVGISLPPSTSGGVTSDSVLASSDLAGQYAQLAALRPELLAAAASLGIPEAALQGHVSAGVVASQNLVDITVSANRSVAAQARANAVSRALVAAVNRTNAATLARYRHNIESILSGNRAQVSRLEATITRNGPISVQDANSNLLDTLLAQRQQINSQLAQEAANEPDVTVLSTASSARVTQPRIILYPLIALLVGLLLTIQIILLIRRCYATP